MFREKNIGSTIKGYAIAMLALEITFAVVGGLILLNKEQVLAGVLTIIAGGLVAWVTFMFLYAFGEITEKTIHNEENTYRILTLLEMQAEDRKRALRRESWAASYERSKEQQKAQAAETVAEEAK